MGGVFAIGGWIQSRKGALHAGDGGVQIVPRKKIEVLRSTRIGLSDMKTLVSHPILFLSPAPLAHILHYDELDDPPGVT